jgi:hypothetical protein
MTLFERHTVKITRDDIIPVKNEPGGIKIDNLEIATPLIYQETLLITAGGLN